MPYTTVYIKIELHGLYVLVVESTKNCNSWRQKDILDEFDTSEFCHGSWITLYALESRLLVLVLVESSCLLLKTAFATAPLAVVSSKLCDR
jgi:hypothetical protein